MNANMLDSHFHAAQCLMPHHPTHPLAYLFQPGLLITPLLLGEGGKQYIMMKIFPGNYIHPLPFSSPDSFRAYVMCTFSLLYVFLYGSSSSFLPPFRPWLYEVAVSCGGGPSRKSVRRPDFVGNLGRTVERRRTSSSSSTSVAVCSRVSPLFYRRSVRHRFSDRNLGILQSVLY